MKYVFNFAKYKDWRLNKEGLSENDIRIIDEFAKYRDYDGYDFIFRSKISFIGISVCGGLANNVAQIFLAGIFMFGSNVKFIAPPMLCASFFTSLALGSFAENFCRKSVWFNGLVIKSPVKSFGDVILI